MNEETIKIFTFEREHEYLLPLLITAFKENEIDHHLRSKYDRAYDGVFVGQKGVGDLYVFRKDEEKARQILEDLLKSRPDSET
jgi:hypothetical protein